VGEVNGEAVFDFMAKGAADTRYDPQPRPVLPQSTRFVSLGSISLLQEPTASSIVEIIAKHRERTTVFFDPNVRPALISSREAYLTQLPGLIGLSHITKVSTQDLEWLYPGEDLAAIAERWLGYGARAVIITQGGDGVTLFRQGHAPVDAHAPAVAVVDTVGAGDTLSGSLLVALLGKNPDLDKLSDDDWRDALTFAASAAAFNCTRAGAQPPTKAELQTFRS
jgi:fructokinase